MQNKPIISVIGLGKLGAPIAAVWAVKGHLVYGVDVNDRVIDMINAGEPPIQETDLDIYLGAACQGPAAQGRLTASKATAQAVLNSDVTFVLVPTPSDPGSKRFLLDFVLPVCEQIATGIAAKDSYHTVVITSTVMPDSMGGPILETLERVSGKKCGMGFGLVYSPEFVALGSVIKDFLNPDFLLIGYAHPRDRDFVAELYLNVIGKAVPILAMDWWNAETAKIALNGFMTVKIAYANLLAEMCETNALGNVDAITEALGYDRRISPHYFRGALSFGGPCFVRDIEALGALSWETGLVPVLPDAIRAMNDAHRYHLVRRVLELTDNGERTVGILGLAYKPNTKVIDWSPGVHLARVLCADGLSVIGYDPLAGETVRAEGIEGLTVVDSLEHCVARSGVLVVAVPWKGFHELEHLPLAGKTILDCWRMLDPDLLGPGVDYVAYGLGREAKPCEL